MSYINLLVSGSYKYLIDLKDEAKPIKPILYFKRSSFKMKYEGVVLFVICICVSGSFWVFRIPVTSWKAAPRSFLLVYQARVRSFFARIEAIIQRAKPLTPNSIHPYLIRKDVWWDITQMRNENGSHPNKAS